ncbi:MAG: translation initiation factor IF-2, partial [Planctomycetota bacterium]
SEGFSLAKRVFEVGKELGVSSKAIVAKCRDEGIPETVIKNHMSTVSAGLEATVREWFSGGDEAAESHTAVEQAKKVDLEKVRAKPRARRATAKAVPAKAAKATGSSDDASPGDGGSGVAVAPPPPPPAAKAAAAPAAPAKPEAPAEPAAPAAPAPAAPEPSSPDATPAPTETPDAPPGAPVIIPAASAPPPPPPKPAAPSQPAGVPNVPTRPKVITPAGPQLASKEKVKLSGPKVVRVEAPERIDDVRRRPSGPPRGPRPGGPGGGGYGGGPGTSDGPGDDRSRRGGANKRRKGAETPGGAGVRRRGAGMGDDSLGTGKFSEADLAERQARLQRSGGYLKQRRQQAKQRMQAGGIASQMPVDTGGPVKITEPFTIKDLSGATGVKGAEIVKKLFLQGIPATINSGIDAERAQEIMMDYEIELEVVEAKSAEQQVSESFASREAVDQRSRGPVVTILGHVDHGKTSLLDKIRNANVAAGEAGGITQATSAFRVAVKVGDAEKNVVFIDTPGHEAFTQMRARGANMTDVIVLVVAADDGVMPQTAESIAHAKAAGVPIVVALNKIDRPEATEAKVQEIYGQLAQHELNPVEWGGDTEVIKTSAIEGTGITELLETLDYQAELRELTADFKGRARGTIIEARVQEGRGAVANMLVQDGELNVGDFIVAGRAFGRVRDITDDRGKKVKTASPPMPVQISGIDEVPDAGDKFFIVDSLKKAQEAAEQRRERDREETLAQPKVTLDTMFSRMAEAELKEILVVVKADVQGSIDVLKHEIEKVSTDEVKVRVLHSAIGGITESDVLLADASKAVIIGFNVIPSGKARRLADDKGVQIRPYQVIYDITDDIRRAAEGMLEPELRQEILGHAEVRQVFKVTRVGAIAGCYITDGMVQRDALIRVTRNDVVIENDRTLEQLKRFKEDAKEVRSGMECGMKIVGYDDIKEGDILECYKQVEVKRSL